MVQTNEHLSLLWINMCTAEKYWLKCVRKCQQAVLKSKYVPARKSFDREVQRAKRYYWYSIQK